MNNKYIIKLALDELNDMQIKSRTIVSKHRKKQITDEELANHIEELRQVLVGKADEVASVMKNSEFQNVYVENLADKYNKKLNAKPENAYECLNQLYEDMADLYQVVKNLLLEELKKENVAEKGELTSQQIDQMLYGMDFGRGANLKGLKKHFVKNYNLSIAPKSMSNLRFVKSTEAREREINKQKEAQRAMTKPESQPEMTARQMSR